METANRPPGRWKLLWQQISLGFGLKIAIGIGGVLLMLDGNYLAGLASFGILAVTFLPYFMFNLLHFRVPAEFETLSIVFIYLTLFLGEVEGFYVKFWWWDIVLHTMSGLLGSMIGFLLVYVLNNNKRINLNLTPIFIALFAYMFAMTIGCLWEIFEYAMDSFFGLDMQEHSLQDTMSDLIVDSVGALIVSTIGYFYLSRKGKGHFLRRFISDFVNANPRIFGRRKKKNEQSHAAKHPHV